MMLADAKVLTVGELSEYLRVHRSTIYRLLKKGQLPGFKIGSDWRFNVEAIDQLAPAARRGPARGVAGRQLDAIAAAARGLRALVTGGVRV